MPKPAGTLISPEIISNIKEMRSNKIWMQSKLHELKGKYPNQFIAIYKRKIIGNHNDYKVLIKILKSKHENIDMIAIEFIVGEDYYLVL